MSHSLLETRDIRKLENNYRGCERAICPIRPFYARSDEFPIIPVVRDDGIRLSVYRRCSTRVLFQTFVTNEINFRSRPSRTEHCRFPLFRYADDSRDGCAQWRFNFLSTYIKRDSSCDLFAALYIVLAQFTSGC